ncbi:hypothetical protein JCM9279_004668 [Rhodotorula babjevae]
MAATPRPVKRRRVDTPTAPPQPAPADDAASDPAPDATTTTAPDQHPAPDEPQARTKEQQEEMERLYDLVAEEYHDIVAEMPLEYQRTFQLMRELEDSQQEHEQGLKTSLGAYIAALLNATAAPSPAASTSTAAEPPTLSPAAREHLVELSEHANKAVRAADDKHGLAVTLYEMVDRHIRRLDADLAKYEDSLVIGLRDGTLPSHDAPAAGLKSPPGATTSLGAIALGEHDAYDAVDGVEGGGKGAGEGAGGRTRARKGGLSAAEREKEREWKRSRELQKRERALKKKEAESGMPIDPNEPTYCYCNRVSFGEMIACENDDCSREWFHLGCVGLEHAPEGKWYCDDCVRELGIDPATMRRK